MIRPDLIVYIEQEKDNNHLDEDIGNSNDVRNDNPQWGEDVVVSELMSIGTTNVHARDQNVIDARDQNPNAIWEQGLKFYVE